METGGEKWKKKDNKQGESLCKYVQQLQENNKKEIHIKRTHLVYGYTQRRNIHLLGHFSRIVYVILCFANVIHPMIYSRASEFETAGDKVKAGEDEETIAIFAAHTDTVNGRRRRKVGTLEHYNIIADGIF